MGSDSLRASGFAAWLPFNSANSAAIVSRTPTAAGVYVIRCRTPFSRVSGVSDVLYVGSAGNRDGLRARLRQYFHPGPTQRTNQRLLNRCGASNDYEISYVVCDSQRAASELEASMLGRYLAEHGELPPENRVLPRVSTEAAKPASTQPTRAPAVSQSRPTMKSGTRRFETVWSRIVSNAGNPFGTVKGLPFTYTVAQGAVRPSRTNRNLPRSDFEKAFARVPLKNTAGVQDLQGPSFVYAIMMDERIRAGEW